MNGPLPFEPVRSIVLDTLDHGPVSFPEPFWCLGEHADGVYRADIVHEGEDQPLTVATSCHGLVQLGVATLVQHPFSESDPRVLVAVEFDEVHEYDAAGLAGMLDALVSWAIGPMHQLVERLQLLAGDES